MSLKHDASEQRRRRHRARGKAKSDPISGPARADPPGSSTPSQQPWATDTTPVRRSRTAPTQQRHRSLAEGNIRRRSHSSKQKQSISASSSRKDNRRHKEAQVPKIKANNMKKDGVRIAVAEHRKPLEPEEGAAAKTKPRGGHPTCASRTLKQQFAARPGQRRKNGIFYSLPPNHAQPRQVKNASRDALSYSLPPLGRRNNSSSNSSSSSSSSESSSSSDGSSSSSSSSGTSSRSGRCCDERCSIETKVAASAKASQSRLKQSVQKPGYCSGTVSTDQSTEYGDAVCGRGQHNNIRPHNAPAPKTLAAMLEKGRWRSGNEAIHKQQVCKSNLPAEDNNSYFVQGVNDESSDGDSVDSNCSRSGSAREKQSTIPQTPFATSDEVVQKQIKYLQHSQPQLMSGIHHGLQGKKKPELLQTIANELEEIKRQRDIIHKTVGDFAIGNDNDHALESQSNYDGHAASSPGHCSLLDTSAAFECNGMDAGSRQSHSSFLDTSGTFERNSSLFMNSLHLSDIEPLEWRIDTN